MNTETLSWVPTVPVIELEAQDKAPLGTMHIVPAESPCAGGESTAANRRLPISIKIDEETIIFFKNYTRILGLLEKAVSLRLVTVDIFNGSIIFPRIPKVHLNVLKIASALDLPKRRFKS